MFEEVKAHVGRHKVAYSVGTVVVVAGVAYYIGVRAGSSKTLSPSASIVGGINYKIDQKVITLVDRQGPPSWVIGQVGTDLEWNSQRETAISEGIRESDLRAHLNGLIKHVNGKQYFRKGLAAA